MLSLTPVAPAGAAPGVAPTLPTPLAIPMLAGSTKIPLCTSKTCCPQRVFNDCVALLIQLGVSRCLERCAAFRIADGNEARACALQSAAQVPSILRGSEESAGTASHETRTERRRLVVVRHLAASLWLCFVHRQLH